MSQILLINPPSPAGKTANREGSAGMGVISAQADDFCYPPQVIATVAAVLRNAGHAVTCVDAVGEKLDLAATLARVPPHASDLLIGVLMSQATLTGDIDFCNHLLADVDANVIAFGPAMRFVGQTVMEQCNVAAVALGEPETAVLRTVQALASPTDDDSNDEWVAGPSATSTDLADLPRPAWDLLPHDRYPFLTLRAGRGCADDCAYCPYVAVEGRTRQVRSADAVADELAWLQQTFPKPRYLFRDIVFAADRAWVEAFCAAVVTRRLKVNWECESRPEHFDLALLRQMARAGCTTIKIGLETVDDEMLELMGRLHENQTADDYRERVLEVMDACAQTNISCRVFVMVGLPGETYAARAQTREFLAAVRPPLLSVKAYRPYAGVRLEQGELGATLNARVGARPLTRSELLELQREWHGLQGEAPPPQGIGSKLASLLGWNRGRSFQVSARRGRRLS